MATRLKPLPLMNSETAAERSGVIVWVWKTYSKCLPVISADDDWVENIGTLSWSAIGPLARVTELWNWPITPTTLSSWTILRKAAMPFSGVPASSPLTSSIGVGSWQEGDQKPPMRW